MLYRPRTRGMFDVDFDDLLLPFGSVFCLLASVGLLTVRSMASSGQIAEPLASMITGQPYVFTVFYFVAAFLSGLLLVVLLLKWLFFRG